MIRRSTASSSSASTSFVFCHTALAQLFVSSQLIQPRFFFGSRFDTPKNPPPPTRSSFVQQQELQAPRRHQQQQQKQRRQQGDEWDMAASDWAGNTPSQQQQQGQQQQRQQQQQQRQHQQPTFQPRQQQHRGNEPIWKKFARRSQENKRNREIEQQQQRQQQQQQSQQKQGVGSFDYIAAAPATLPIARSKSNNNNNNRSDPNQQLPPPLPWQNSATGSVGGGHHHHHRQFNTSNQHVYLSSIGRTKPVRSLFDVDLQAESEVRMHCASLGQQRCEIFIEDVKNLEVCYLDVPIPKQWLQLSSLSSSSSSSSSSNSISLFRCRGVAKLGTNASRQLAEQLCFTHASQVIQHAQAGRADLAFQYAALVFKDAVDPPPLQHPGNDPGDFDSWAEYVEHVQRYVAESRAQSRQRILERGKWHYTLGDEPLAEQMLHRLVTTEQSVNGRMPLTRPVDVQHAVNLAEPPVMLTMRTDECRLWVCVMQLPHVVEGGAGGGGSSGSLHAVGFSKSKKNAQCMCCMHAIGLGKAMLRASLAVASHDSKSPSLSSSSSITTIATATAQTTSFRHQFPRAKKLFYLLGRLQAPGLPVVSVRFCMREGRWLATVTPPVATTTTTATQPFSVIAPTRATAVEEAYARYFAHAKETTPSLERFMALVSDEQHATTDSADILDVMLQQGMREKVAAAVALLGPPTPEDEDAEAGKLAPELRLERAALRLHSHLANKSRSDVAALSQRMKEQLHEMRNSQRYKDNFERQRAALPMASKKDELLSLMTDQQQQQQQGEQQHRVVICCATTGGGKTTQVPQYLLDAAIEAGTGAECTILVTQPRRISAISISERIAAERCESVGESVGYTIRLDSRPGRNITLLTTGVLLQLLRVDPALRGVKYLVIDEIHERDLHCDFSLILAREALRLNPDLRLICMSATLQADTFSRYFDGAPIIDVDGRLHPVQEVYLEDLPKLAEEAGVRLPYDPTRVQQTQQHRNPRFRQQGRPATNNTNNPSVDADMVAASVDLAIERLPPNTSILVFVAGWKDITDCKAACMNRCRTARRHQYVLLHSTISKEDQMMAFRRAPEGKVKIVIATNIAESGITIDDVGCVIDCGVIKEMSYLVTDGTAGTSATATEIAQQQQQQKQQQKQPQEVEEQQEQQQEHEAPTGSVFRLRTAWASQANCTQRRGRAGRTRGGLCFRLFTRRHFESRPSYQVPEMLRMPLETVILQSIAMGHGDPVAFFGKALDVPSPRLLEHSIRQLRALGAIHDDYKLTWLGQWLVKIPADPATAKMILIGAMLRCLDPVLTIAAAADAPVLTRNLQLRPEVNQARFEVGASTLSDSVTDVLVLNSIVGTQGHINSPGLDMARPQPPEGTAPVPRHLVQWRSLDVVSRYKMQFFDILLSSGWRVSYKRPQQQQQEEVDEQSNNGEKTISNPITSGAAGVGFGAYRANFKMRQRQHQQQQQLQATTTLDENGQPQQQLFAEGTDPFAPSSSSGAGPFFIDTSSASENAHEVELIKAVVTCALYPNVALADARKRKGKWNCRTRVHREIPLGSTCVATRISKDSVSSALHSRLFVYNNVLDMGGGEFLENVTHTNVWALLLLAAGDDHVTFSPDFRLGLIDGWILFRSDAETIEALQQLRKLLGRCFGRLLRHRIDASTVEALGQVRAIIKDILCHHSEHGIQFASESEQQQSHGGDSDDDNDDDERQQRRSKGGGNNNSEGFEDEDDEDADEA